MQSQLEFGHRWCHQRRSFLTVAHDAGHSQGVDFPRGRPPRHLGRWICWLAVVSSMTGCAYTGDWLHNGLKVGPNYCKPAAPVADEWIDAYDQRIRSELPDNPQWWLVFNDPVMTQLVDEMYGQNLSLREAGFRVLQARYQRAIAMGSLLPQSQRAAGAFDRRLNSREAITTRFLPHAFSEWNTGFDMTWELDVWGKFRRNIEAADATLDASVEDYDAILLSLLAETAATYVEVRTLEQRLRYARSNVEIQEGSLRIVETQFRGGTVTELDVSQAKTILQNTRELIPALTAQRRQANNRLCVLVGLPPRDISEELGEAPIPTPPPTVAVGIPANLVRRRPDVRKAERDVAAQSARIGVAAADLLPHFSIFGLIGYQAESLGDLFTASASKGSILPGFDWDILNYGRLLNNVRFQDARFQELAVAYQQTVLQAGEETENAIVAFLQSQQRLTEVQGAVEASKRSLDIVTTQYREGQVDYNRVFTIQDVLVGQQDRLASVEGDVASSLIAIYKALGGGWEIRLSDGTPLPVAVEPMQDREPAPEPPEDEEILLDPDA